jgi:O-antigen ligase
VLRRVRSDRQTIWQLAILIVVSLAAAAAWAVRGNVIKRFSANSDVNYRLEIWQTVWNLIAIHPLKGRGWVGL